MQAARAVGRISSALAIFLMCCGAKRPENSYLVLRHLDVLERESLPRPDSRIETRYKILELVRKDASELAFLRVSWSYHSVSVATGARRHRVRLGRWSFKHTKDVDLGADELAIPGESLTYARALQYLDAECFVFRRLRLTDELRSSKDEFVGLLKATGVAQPGHECTKKALK